MAMVDANMQVLATAPPGGLVQLLLIGALLELPVPEAERAIFRLMAKSQADSPSCTCWSCTGIRAARAQIPLDKPLSPPFAPTPAKPAPKPMDPTRARIADRVRQPHRLGVTHLATRSIEEAAIDFGMAIHDQLGDDSAFPNCMNHIELAVSWAMNGLATKSAPKPAGVWRGPDEHVAHA